MKDKKPSFYSDTRKTIRILIVTVSFLGAFAYANLGLSLFSSGTTISSTDMNANFEKIEKAITSNLILKNAASTTLTDPDGCKLPNEVINLDATGSEVTNYNAGTGEFTFNESGMYEVIQLFKCDSCSKVMVYLCTDEGQAPGDCLNNSKAEKVYLGEIADYAESGISRYINIDSSSTYKIIANLCSNITFTPAGSFQLYFKKVR